MKIIQLLPEFSEGGVERHVLALSNELSKMGHTVLVVSGGGKLQKNLKNVEHWALPVYQKNPATGLYAAIKIANRAKQEKWNLIHAHSRVPAWIAWWASCFSGVPFVVTAHSTYSKNMGIAVFKKAAGAICISRWVYEYLDEYLPAKRVVILNGLPPLKISWKGELSSCPFIFLFVGRLTKLKGLHIVLEALKDCSFREKNNWRLDIVGDGPFKQELEIKCADYNLSDKVFFHGFQDNPDQWMSECSCFLFPSLSEGMGLTLMRAIQMKVPVLASDLPPVKELSFSSECLITPGSVSEWKDALEEIILTRETKQFFMHELPFHKDMARDTANFYEEILT